MFDLVITHATLIDGTGAERRQADVAVRDGRIAAVVDVDANGSGPDWEAASTIDARGSIVTPGWVDVHTHYDGQVSWDDRLDPSAGHGVTTVVTGNCGVGFAPVRPGSEDWLVQLMEGVEDIPGAALSEGIAWGWEHFGEYLDAIGSRHYAMDVATQIAHGPVRGYVMGERGASNEPATEDDIAAMARIVREAVEAGAVGFSTSRTLGHVARDGRPVPGTFAEPAELFGIADAMAATGRRVVFEAAQGGLTMLDRGSTVDELGWMSEVARRTGLPVSYILLQTDATPDHWREVLAAADSADAGDGSLWAQIAARPFGMLISLGTNHPFLKRPSYVEVANLPVAERAAAMSDPARRARILAEDDLPPDPSIAFDGIGGFLAAVLDKLFPLGDTPDYEPTPDRAVTALAEAAGEDPLAFVYDRLVGGDGDAMFLLPLFNYSHGDHEAIREMLTAPGTISGLGDAGAHCGMICDASIPTYLLTHWARDRTRGLRLRLEDLVRKQTLDTASLYGLTDRGVVAVGKRADLNVIDLDGLALRAPRIVYDLPAGGRRIVQDAVGYRSTIVAGQVVTANGVDTGARPGRLVRGV